MTTIDNLKYLKEKYDTRLLTLDQVADELGWKRASINPSISTGRFLIPTVKVCGTRRVEIERLAAYMDEISEQAEREFEGK